MSGLEVEDLEAGYGAMPVLHGVRLHVGVGEAVALMGRNGMGKTTTVRAICGLLAGRGRVRLDGRDILGRPAHRIARAGIGLVPEGRRIFAPLSVAENLIAASRPGPWTQARVTALFPRLGERIGQRAGTLSGGEQQMLAIGRALMTNPRLLILDEATEGLAPVVRQEIWAAIAALKAEGLSLLVIDKSPAELARVADRAVILARGRPVWEGALADLGSEVAQRHLGV